MAADDDYFDDDDDDFLDNLEELREIENAAVLASLTQKQQQQQQPPPRPPPKSQYQISSRAAAYNSSNRAQNQTQGHAGPNRPHTNAGYQPPKPPVPAAPAQPSALSDEEQAIRNAFLARNHERQRLRQQQQDAYLAQQKDQGAQAVQQQAYLASQKQIQLSQVAGGSFSHRQRQLLPKGSTPYRQPPSSFITQPTLPSSPLDRVRPQSGTTNKGQDETSNRSASNVHPAANGTVTGQYHTARSIAQAQTVGVAQPEEYETYDQAKELWDAAAPTEVVLQQPAGTVALEASVLGTSAFGTSAWIPTVQDTTSGSVYHNVTNNDMADYEAEISSHRISHEAPMDIDDAPKGLAADQLEELERLRKAAQQLLADKEDLEKKLKQVTMNVQTKAGENSILRKKMEKAEMQHKSEVDAIRSLAQQKHEKSEADMAKLQADFVKMQEAQEFERNDNKEMHRELKQYQEKVKQTTKSTKDLNPITPRKSRLANFRDGFDDDEAGMSMRSSPPINIPTSRGRGTPSKSTKRKRKLNDSPMKTSQIAVLPILKSNNSQKSVVLEMAQQTEEDEYESMIDRLTLEDLGLGSDDRQQFLETMLSYKPDHGQSTILEVLEQYHFPSDKETSLSALFMENVPQADIDAAYGEFPARICCILIALWDRCYTEKFFAPLSLLLGFLDLAIIEDFGKQLFAIIVEPFAEALQKTVMLNSLERFKGQSDRINPLVDVEKCLQLFESVSLGVLIDEDLARHFWTLIHPDFIAPFMTWNQPISHIRLILNALPSSVFTSSYGPISADPLQQKDYERITLIHASFLLTTEPKTISAATTTAAAAATASPTGISPLPGIRRAQILSIRTAILTFYSSIATTDHGINSLVTNSNWQALSRIIVRIHHELEEIFEDRYGLENSVAFVNTGIRFIHRVLKLQRANDDIERLLSNTTHNGNGHKHLVAFARVAFIREKGWLNDVGIRPEVVEMAMEVLESSVTMEQGDEIWGLFRGRPGGYGAEASMTESMIEADKILREEEMKR